MNNLDLYNRYAQPPESALKAFSNGKFSGTDINPMWRIKALTEAFGPCGLGWYTDIVRMWREDTEDGTATVYCHLNLYIKQGEDWSKPISGVGGNTLMRKTKSGTSTTDEAYKMAFTDAMGIACKALGIGADIWWKEARSKYTANDVAQFDAKAEIARIKAKFGSDGFAQMRASLIAGGVVPDIPSDKMTAKDWQHLIGAIDANFGDAA
jgi:hypothetical protein